jgi:hypothetical protein
MEKINKARLFQKYAFEVLKGRLSIKFISALTFYSWNISSCSDKKDYSPLI